MRYALIKTADCSVSYGCFKKYAIGSVIPYAENHNRSNVNEMMKAAHEFNSNTTCTCKVEVKEVEE